MITTISSAASHPSGLPPRPLEFVVSDALSIAARTTGISAEILRPSSGGPITTSTGVDEIVGSLKTSDSIRTLVNAALRELMNGLQTSDERAILFEAANAISMLEQSSQDALCQALLRHADPVTVIRTLHQRDGLGILSQHLTALLGITDEEVGGDLEIHSADQQKIFNARGGYMYQASDVQEIRNIFSKIQFNPGTSFYDLGSGYGHVVFYGAIVRPDVVFKGIELMSSRTVECERVRSRLDLSNLTFEAADVVTADISQADVLFLFNPFPPDVRVEVARKINERASQSRLMVIDYGGMVTQDVSELTPATRHPFYPYRVAVARRFREESLGIAKIESISGQRVRKGGSR